MHQKVQENLDLMTLLVFAFHVQLVATIVKKPPMEVFVKNTLQNMLQKWIQLKRSLSHVYPVL